QRSWQIPASRKQFSGKDLHGKLLSRSRDLPAALLPPSEAYRHGQVLPDANAVEGRRGLEDPDEPVRKSVPDPYVYAGCSRPPCTDTPSLARDNHGVVNREHCGQWSHPPAGRVDGLEPQ